MGVEGHPWDSALFTGAVAHVESYQRDVAVLDSAYTSFQSPKLPMPQGWLAGSLHFFGFGFGVCLAAARQNSTRAPFSQTGPKSRLVPPKVERPLASSSPQPP